MAAATPKAPKSSNSKPSATRPSKSGDADSSDLPPGVVRRFGRHKTSCAALLAFPARNAHPRIKGRMLQIGRGGCALSTEHKLYIGEPCLVWATAGGHKFLGVQGKIVWLKSIYDGHETTLVGIEFDKAIELDAELKSNLGIKP